MRNHSEEENILLDGCSPVSKQEGESLAKQIGAWGYYETSALKQEGVTQVFDAVIQAAKKRNVVKVDKPGNWLQKMF